MTRQEHQEVEGGEISESNRVINDPNVGDHSDFIFMSM